MRGAGRFFTALAFLVAPARAQDHPNVIAVTILADGTIQWEGVTLSGVADFEERLKKISESRSEVVFTIDAKAKYDRVAFIMAEAQKFNLRIGFAVGPASH